MDTYEPLGMFLSPNIGTNNVQQNIQKIWNGVFTFLGPAQFLEKRGVFQ